MFRGLIGRRKSLYGLHITEEVISLTILHRKFCWSGVDQHGVCVSLVSMGSLLI